MKCAIGWRRLSILFGVGVAMSIALLLGSGIQRARAVMTFTVINTADSGLGSLRDAIIQANANPGSDTINFQPGLNGTITLTSGKLPTITDPLTISGPGAALMTISGNHASLIFEVASGVMVNISDLSIVNGFNFVGGAIFNNGGTLFVSNSVLSGNNSSAGGGVANLGGFLTITNCTMSGNTAAGGGVYNAGGVVLINSSTMSNNFATGGGGVFNQGGTMTLTNSTISGNMATLGNFALGGGIFIDSGIVRVSNCTLSGNLALNGGGGIRAIGGIVNIKNTIVANSIGGDCVVTSPGTLNAFGVNVSTDGTCPGFTQVSATQLKLAPLSNYGGHTKTHALLRGSVAIDAVTDCTDLAGNLITQDQRGVMRPIDGNCDQNAQCDVGSFEAPSCNTIIFNVCLQDDSNSGVVFFGNTETGAYLFCCAGTVFDGIAQVTVRGSVATFQDYTMDRRLLAKVDGGVFKGSATLQSPPGTTICLITDRDTKNNDCVCR